MPPSSLIFIPKTGCAFDVAPSTAGEVTVFPLSQEDAATCVQEIKTISSYHSSEILAQIVAELSADQDPATGLLRLVKANHAKGSTLAFEYITSHELKQNFAKYQEMNPTLAILSLQALQYNTKQEFPRSEILKQYYAHRMKRDESFHHIRDLQSLSPIFELRGTFAYIASDITPDARIQYYLRQIKLMEEMDAHLLLERLESSMLSYSCNCTSSFAETTHIKLTHSSHAVYCPITFLYGDKKVLERNKNSHNDIWMTDQDSEYQYVIMILEAIQKQAKRKYPYVQEFIFHREAILHQKQYSKPYCAGSSHKSLLEAFRHQRGIPTLQQAKGYSMQYDQLNAEYLQLMRGRKQLSEIDSFMTKIKELKTNIHQSLFLAEKRFLLGQDLLKDDQFTYSDSIDVNITESSLFKEQAKSLLTEQIDPLEQKVHNLLIENKIGNISDCIDEDSQTLEKNIRLLSTFKSSSYSEDKVRIIKNTILHIQKLQKDFLNHQEVLEGIQLSLHSSGSQALSPEMLGAFRNQAEHFSTKLQTALQSAETVIQAKKMLESLATCEREQDFQQAQKMHEKFQEDFLALSSSQQNITLMEGSLKHLEELSRETADNPIESIDDAVEKSAKRIKEIEEIERNAVMIGNRFRFSDFKASYVLVKELRDRMNSKYGTSDCLYKLDAIINFENTLLNQCATITQTAQCLFHKAQNKKLEAELELTKLKKRARQIQQVRGDTIDSPEELIRLLAESTERVSQLEANQNAIETENQRLKRQLTELRVESANRHAESENQLLRTQIAEQQASNLTLVTENARLTAQSHRVESANRHAESENQLLRTQLAEQQASNLTLVTENARLTAQSQQPPSLIQRFFDSIAAFFRRIFRRNPNRAQNDPVEEVSVFDEETIARPIDPPPHYDDLLRNTTPPHNTFEGHPTYPREENPL